MKTTVIAVLAVLILVALVGWISLRSLWKPEIVISPGVAPTHVAHPNSALDSVRLDATRFPRIILGDKDIDFSELAASLSSHSKEAVVDIVASGSADPTAVVRVLDVLKKAGYSKIRFSTKSENEK